MNKLLSAFEQLKDRTLYANKAYNSDKFRDMQPKELSHGRKGKLVFTPQNMAYWEEYFCQFDTTALEGVSERVAVAMRNEVTSVSVSKADKLHQVRS